MNRLTLFVAPLLAAGTVNASTLGGVDLGNLTDYLFVFTDANVDANWQSSSKGYVGDVAVDGIQASERTSGTVPYAGTISTNDAILDAWQGIVDDNSGQASASTGQGALVAGLETDLQNAFTQINGLTSDFSVSDANNWAGFNSQDGFAQTYVVDVTGGFNVSNQIFITGDPGDFFIFRWDEDTNLGNGYNGQVKFQSGAAFVPVGGLTAGNFIHVAGDLNASGGGSTPGGLYPQGPRLDDGQGALIAGGQDFSGGGFFTGYWLTTGDPDKNFENSSLNNGIFVGGWYSSNTKFSMTSGTSGVYVAPIPEPSSLLLAFLGSALLFLRRRR